jgi:CubicO group peptidase (beta-lactamase class C family)
MHASKSRLAVVLALMSAACAGPRPDEIATTAVEADQALGVRVDAAAADALREIAVAGFSVAVVRHGRPVLAEGLRISKPGRARPGLRDHHLSAGFHHQ